MTRLWDSYWSWVGGNIGAMPLQALIAAVSGVVAALVLRPLWRRMWAWLKRELGADSAAAAHRIAADLFEHHTGRAHPDAPDSEREVP